MKTVRPKVAAGCAPVVEIAGADRIEAGGRLVQDTSSGSSASARQRHALDHAAGEFGRVAVGNFGLEAHHHELGDHPRRAVLRGLRYSRTGNWMFCRTVSEENSAPC